VGIDAARRIVRGAVIAALCLFLAACGPAVFETLTAEEDRDYALSILRALQSGDDATIKQNMSEGMARKIEPKLPAMRAYLPADAKTEPRLVDASVQFLTASRKTRLVYAMDDDKRHALASLVIVRLKGDVFLQTLSVTQLKQPIEDLAPSFQLAGKHWSQYLFLSCAALSFAMIVAALYLLYRATDVPRKWPWAVACVLGLGQFTMNWDTGQLSAHAWAVQPLGVMVMRPGILASWYISFGLPIGAYIFLLRQAHVHVAKREIRIQR
jgi:hypothetical protein